MFLNCDLGEGFGSWTMGQDAQLMPWLQQASIACGFHAGDPSHMLATLALAKTHQLMIGAHPGYPDLQGFGRRALAMSPAEMQAMVIYQIGALAGLAHTLGLKLRYVKPHGALYHCLRQQPEQLAALLQALQAYNAEQSQPLALMLQAGPWFARLEQQAQSHGIELWAEAFIDRGYLADGSLAPRGHPAAVLPLAERLTQGRALLAGQAIQTLDGHWLELQADSLCLHGDDPLALATLQALVEQSQEPLDV